MNCWPHRWPQNKEGKFWGEGGFHKGHPGILELRAKACSPIPLLLVSPFPHINCAVSSKGRDLAGITCSCGLWVTPTAAEFPPPYEQIGFGGIRESFGFHLRVFAFFVSSLQTSRKHPEQPRDRRKHTNGQGASNPGAPWSPLSPLGPLEPFFPLSPCK